MGICMSSANEDVEQKKRSQAIDRKLEDDSRRLRRECKILLLGALSPCPASSFFLSAILLVISPLLFSSLSPSLLLPPSLDTANMPPQAPARAASRPLSNR
jgi:hypothetical protein